MSELGALAAQVHALLRELDATVAVAESLTGGLLCAALTETPGASRTMRGGLVVYATETKHLLAGVDPDLLAQRGPIDPRVAAALAEAARRRAGATFGVGVTGVAGPEPQDGKPVGLVYAACAGPGGTDVREYRLAGDRGAVRSAAVRACLELLRSTLGPPTV